MKTIWKFRLSDEVPLDEQPDGLWEVFVEAPDGAIPRHVAMDGDNPAVWMEVDDEAPLSKMRFIVSGTGRRVFDAPYIGTVHDNLMVWHIWGPAD